LLNATLLELAGALEAKKVSSVELTRAFLARIQRLNGELNAFITVDPERSLADARRADERRARGEKGALLGIPVGFKDIYCTKGQRTTCGSRMLAEFKSPYDAHVVERFDAAGVVSLGKCNMDEFAMGSSNESSHFGPVKNPWDKRRVPGGSSGGSAAAVAADLRPRVALRAGRLRLVPRPGGTDRADRCRPRSAARRHGRLRRARLHQRAAGKGKVRLAD
jgi:aspartyl-tRNA(Asn)/glutamyl-tRNA(Gln) amidotransferase subunit A